MVEPLQRGPVPGDEDLAHGDSALMGPLGGASPRLPDSAEPSSTMLQRPVLNSRIPSGPCAGAAQNGRLVRDLPVPSETNSRRTEDPPHTGGSLGTKSAAEAKESGGSRLPSSTPA
ncbi:hypothetical protein NDU88_005277 [Pleurodeles waltl]|uniref:Uncharacterized protein n=1 Tax=Pleurodeles waltl TaxID=8319 RepID=A0AAV7UJE7_PLEWA|nr:hypothetical protein NDU88_005277 [Pleurodeles waltl]